MTSLFIVGPPGVGKTTITRFLLGYNVILVEKPKWTIGLGSCAVGHYSGQTFDGGDTVPYNGVNDCLDFWNKELLPKQQLSLTMFDGDRFSNRGVIDFFVERNIRVLAVHINAPEEKLEQRRKERGSNQNASWIKGRITKARRFADMVEHLDIYDVHPVQAAIKIQEFLHERSK